jgi:Flp pilus assembly protein TadG
MNARDPLGWVRRRFRFGRRGVAALEFALIAPVLILLLLGVYDIGNAVDEQMVLQQALRAAGQYAISFPNSSDGILAAIQQGYPSSWTGVTPTVKGPSGDTPPYYVTLKASLTFPSLILPLPTSTLTYVVRVQ